MQSPDTPDAPLVPFVATSRDERNTRPTDGVRHATLDFDRPPRTDHATEYTRDEEEIEPFVADLR